VAATAILKYSVYSHTSVVHDVRILLKRRILRKKYGISGDGLPGCCERYGISQWCDIMWRHDDQKATGPRMHRQAMKISKKYCMSRRTIKVSFHQNELPIFVYLKNNRTDFFSFLIPSVSTFCRIKIRLIWKYFTIENKKSNGITYILNVHFLILFVEVKEYLWKLGTTGLFYRDHCKSWLRDFFSKLIPWLFQKRYFDFPFYFIWT